MQPEARDFYAAERLRMDCRRRGILELDVGPEAVAATFLPGWLRSSKAKRLKREGDRIVCPGLESEEPFDRVEEFLEILEDD
jgi:transcription-repair coupling factor (superfamily II helicase)